MTKHGKEGNPPVPRPLLAAAAGFAVGLVLIAGGVFFFAREKSPQPLPAEIPAETPAAEPVSQPRPTIEPETPPEPKTVPDPQTPDLPQPEPADSPEPQPAEEPASPPPQPSIEQNLAPLAEEFKAIEQIYPVDEAACDRLLALSERLPDAEGARPLAEKIAALQKQFLVRLDFERKLAAFGGFSGDLRRWKAFLLDTAADQSADFSRAAEVVDCLAALEDWNGFVAESAEALNRFAVAAGAAQKALDFYTENQSRLGFLPQWEVFDRRLADWAADAHPAAICEGISALLSFPMDEAWIHEPQPGRYYYLTEPPREGENTYRADLFGNTGQVTLSAEEAASARHLAMGELYGRWREAAWAIPDSLRHESPSKWYGGWSALLIDMRAGGPDPLLTVYLLRDTAKVLAAGDRYFAARVGVWQQMLANERIPEGLDPFDGSPRTADARQTAAELLPFLPTAQLTVDKDDRQLDEMVDRVSGLYRPVGWLDTDTRGGWFLRPADTPEQEARPRRMVLFAPGAEGAPRAVELGTLPAAAGALPLVSDGLVRGLPVFAVE